MITSHLKNGNSLRFRSFRLPGFLRLNARCLASCLLQELSSLIIHDGNTRRDAFEFMQPTTKVKGIAVKSRISLKRISATQLRNHFLKCSTTFEAKAEWMEILLFRPTAACMTFLIKKLLVIQKIIRRLQKQNYHLNMHCPGRRQVFFFRCFEFKFFISKPSTRENCVTIAISHAKSLKANPQELTWLNHTTRYNCTISAPSPHITRHATLSPDNILIRRLPTFHAC